MIGIYRIVNLKNNKVYIGSSINIEKRFREHLSLLRKNIHFNNHLQNAFNKYGENNFKFEKLIEVPEEMLLLKEEEYIKKNLAIKNGYNILNKPTSGMKGFRHSNKSKGIMSRKKTGKPSPARKFSDDEVFKIRELHFSGESVSKLSKKFKVHRKTISRIVNYETYQYVSKINNKHKKYMLKRKKSIKELISKNSFPKFNKGNLHSEEFKEKMKKVGSRPKKHLRVLTNEQVINIRSLKKEGATCRELAEKYSVNQNTISRICRRLIYKDIR